MKHCTIHEHHHALGCLLGADEDEGLALIAL